MEVLIKNRAAAVVLEEIADAYRSAFPGRYADFIQLIREEQTRLLKPSALSTEGTLQAVLKIPEDIFGFVKWQMQKRCGIHDFFRRSTDYDLLAKVWSDLRIRRRESPKFFKDGKCPSQ